MKNVTPTSGTELIMKLLNDLMYWSVIVIMIVTFVMFVLGMIVWSVISALVDMAVHIIKKIFY